MEEKISNLERMVDNVVESAERRGAIKFTSLETEMKLKKDLMELYIRRREIIGRKKPLIDDSRYAGKQGQSRDTKKYYKQKMKTAKRALKEINKEYEAINSEFNSILNKIGISDPRKITQTEIYFQNAYDKDMKEARESTTVVPKVEVPLITIEPNNKGKEVVPEVQKGEER